VVHKYVKNMEFSLDLSLLLFGWEISAGKIRFLDWQTSGDDRIVLGFRR